MPNLKETQLIFEAYRSINEIYEDRYEFRSTRDGYAIVDHSIRGPNNVLARFDRDEKNEAIARYKHYTKQLSPNEIRAGFDKLRGEFNEAFANHSWSEAIEEAGRGLTANKGEWEEVSGDTIKGNKDVQQDVFDIIKTAYGPIGGHPDFNTIDKVPGDNNIAAVIDTDEPDDVDAAILSKSTSFGTKITTFASDGGTEAKRAAIAKTVDLLNTPGNYVEVSGKLQDILIAKGAPTVDDEDTVRTVLKGKEIMWHGDGVYSREIGGKPYTKKMLGKPLI